MTNIITIEVWLIYWLGMVNILLKCKWLIWLLLGPHYGRYPNYHMGVSQPMSMNRGSMNGPSGYSLSQPGEPRLRPTYGNSRQRPVVLKNIKEGSLRERR